MSFNFNLISVLGRKFGTSPPSPGPTWDRGFCLDSPTRKSLQRDATFLPQTIRKLGRGGFGTVVLGTWQSRRVAVKILSQRDQLIFDREVAASDRLDHPNIVKVLTIFKGIYNNNGSSKSEKLSQFQIISRYSRNDQLAFGDGIRGPLQPDGRYPEPTGKAYPTLHSQSLHSVVTGPGPLSQEGSLPLGCEACKCPGDKGPGLPGLQASGLRLLNYRDPIRPSCWNTRLSGMFTVFTQSG